MTVLGDGNHSRSSSAAGDLPVGFQRLTVQEVRSLTSDSYALSLQIPTEIAHEFTHLPGQHLVIAHSDGVRRSYSIIDDPVSRPSTLTVGIRQLVGGAFSEHTLPKLRPGDTLVVSKPMGRFCAEPAPALVRQHVAIAAGSGITPILSIVGTLLRDEPRSMVTLVYANRTADSVMFLDELHDLKDRYPTRFNLIHVLSRETRDLELLSGRLDGTRLVAVLDAFLGGRDQGGQPVGDQAAPGLPNPAATQWYLCGPQALVQGWREALADQPGQVHAELFHADAALTSARPAVDLPAGTAQVQVTLAGRSTTFALSPEGASVLDAAMALRSDLPFACKGGVCGTCRAKVTVGSVVMRANHALEADELAAGYVLTCQSHPSSEQVALDYDA